MEDSVIGEAFPAADAPANTHSPRRLVAIGPIAIAVLYAVVHCFSTMQAIVRLLLRGEAWGGGDFSAFYATALISYRMGLTPYMGDQVQKATGIPSAFNTTYPPFSILVFTPYTLTDITTAFIIHTLVNLVAAGVLFFYIYKMFLSHIESRYVLVVVVGLLFWESISSSQNFIRGQTNLIIAALLVFAWYGIRRGERPIATGIAIGFATLIKVYFAILLVPMFLLQRKTSAIAATLVVVVAVIVSVVFFPAVGWHDWFSVVLPAGALGQNPPGVDWAGLVLNHSINGLLTRNIGDPVLIKAIGYPLIALVLGGTAYALFRLRALARQDAVDAAMPIMLSAIFLISPLSWVSNYVYLWLAVLGTMELRRRMGQLGNASTMLLLGLLLLFCLPWHEFTFGKYEKLFGIPATMGVFVLWISCWATAISAARFGADRKPIAG